MHTSGVIKRGILLNKTSTINGDGKGVRNRDVTGQFSSVTCSGKANSFDFTRHTVIPKAYIR